MCYRSGAVNMSSEVGVTMRMGTWASAAAETFVQSCHVSSSLSLLKSLTGYTIHIEDKLIAVLREESRELLLPICT